MVTVNSDDPPMFDTDLNHEYQVLVEQFDFQVQDLEKISLNGIKASLLPEDEKRQIIAEFKNEFKEIRAALS
jgi:aminodeoxyfutalosine deaminase